MNKKAVVWPFEFMILGTMIGVAGAFVLYLDLKIGDSMGGFWPVLFAAIGLCLAVGGFGIAFQKNWARLTTLGALILVIAICLWAGIYIKDPRAGVIRGSAMGVGALAIGLFFLLFREP